MFPSIMACCPGPEASKQPQTSHYHHHVWLLVWCSFYEILCWFYARFNGTQPSKKFSFCRISPQNICPKVLGIIRYFLANVRRAFVHFLSAMALPWNSLMDAVFAQSLSYCWIMNTDLNWGKWGLRFFRCCSGFFYNKIKIKMLF